MASIGFNIEKRIWFQEQQNILKDNIPNEISHFMRLCGCYGSNQVVVIYTEGESKVTADNVNAENCLRIKMHLLVKEMNGH